MAKPTVLGASIPSPVPLRAGQKVGENSKEKLPAFAQRENSNVCYLKVQLLNSPLESLPSVKRQLK